MFQVWAQLSQVLQARYSNRRLGNRGGSSAKLILKYQYLQYCLADTHLQLASAYASCRWILYVYAAGQHVAAEAEVIELIGHVPAGSLPRKALVFNLRICKEFQIC